MNWRSIVRFSIILISIGTSILYLVKGIGILILTAMETLLLLYLASKDT